MKKIELLPHNQTLYEQIVKEIENGERSIFYSEATGLGKSFIFMRLVQEYFTGKKILYIVPKIAIWENLTKYKEFSFLSADIEMTTFTAFNKYDETLCEKYDAVFIDECHHMLSDIQGKNVLQFCIDMVSEGKFAFGLTATPYYQGEYVDEKCFGVSCYGLDVFEAIECGLLPKVKLALANIDLNTLPKDVRAKFSITGTKPLVERIIEEHPEINKWLAYFVNKTELEKSVKEIQLLFPEYEILKIYEGIGNEQDIFSKFEASNNKVILMSVNKLLEGIHLSGVEGVLLYRNVIEFSTYMQMYGRLCNINATSSPLFLDITNAILSVNRFGHNKSQRFTGTRKKYTKHDLLDVSASDYWTIELSEYIKPTKDTYYKDIPAWSPKAASLALGKCAGYIASVMRANKCTIQQAIDFALERKEKLNSSYKGIPTCDAVAASKALGKPNNYINRIMNNKGYTIQQAIDYALEQQENAKKTYRNIPISTPVAASIALGYSKGFVSVFMRKNNCTIQKAIDMILEEKEKQNLKKASLYKGIPTYSAYAASEALGKHKQYISSLMKYYNWSIQEAIDYALEIIEKESEVTYKGIPITSAREASLALNTYEVCINQLMNRHNCTIKEAIDMVLAKQEKETEFYKGIPTKSGMAASLALGLSRYRITDIMRRNNCTIQEAIDMVLAKQEKKTEFYKGIPIHSACAASRALNHSDSFISSIMRKRNCTIEEAIDFALEQEEKERKNGISEGTLYKGIPITSAREASLALNLNKNYINVVMSRRKCSIQEAIDYALEKKEAKKNY